ncbi:hypothetical protein HYX19_04920 [Candidatus Woesearchaeota archaeon]|nr:hypothetical protein [Candidatus Woesearchaeota archaeon]
MPGNSPALDLESKVKNVQESCLKRMQESGENLVFNIKGNIIEIPRGESNSSLKGFLLNGRRIEKTGYRGHTFISYYDLIDVGELSSIVTAGWGIDRLDIGLDGNIEASIKKEQEMRFLYIGKFNKNDCSFKENPLEASIYSKIYTLYYPSSFSNNIVVSYSPFGGHLYFDAEKSQYTVDVLGTIRNTNFPSDNRVISWISGSYGVNVDINFLNNVPNGKGESGFAYFQFFSASYRIYESLPSFFKRDDAVILAVQKNFGDGQVFMFRGFKDDEPIFESTPFRVSADGIIRDIREKVTLKDGIQVPKPILEIFFGGIYPPYATDKALLHAMGYRIHEDDLKGRF